MSNSNFTEEFIKEEIIEKTDAILGRLEQCNLIRLFASRLRKEIEGMKIENPITVATEQHNLTIGMITKLLPPHEEGEKGKEV